MRTHNLQKPARLYWDISPKLAGIIENAVRVAQKVNILPNLCEVQTIVRKKKTFPRLCSKITSFFANTKCYPVHYEHQWPGHGTSHSHTLNMLQGWLARRFWCTKSHSSLLKSSLCPYLFTSATVRDHIGVHTAPKYARQSICMISDDSFSRSTLGSFAPSQKLCQNHCSYV